MMEEINFKIATWNPCLGLKNKKDYVEKIMNENKINMCCLQEIELEPNFEHNLLSTRDFTLLVKKNDYKSRTGVYLKNGTIFIVRKNVLPCWDLNPRLQRSESLK